MNLELEQHTAVVTGGASGIGLATARAFALEGARVALWDHSERTSETAGQLARETNAEVIGIPPHNAQEPNKCRKVISN